MSGDHNMYCSANRQAEALLIADELIHTKLASTRYKAAAELRRLHSVNAQLLEALEMGYADTMDYIKRNHLSGSENNHWLVAARAAIAAAKEMK